MVAKSIIKIFYREIFTIKQHQTGRKYPHNFFLFFEDKAKLQRKNRESCVRAEKGVRERQMSQ